MIKVERQHQQHLEDLRRRVALLERIRPEEQRTKELSRSLATVERRNRCRDAFARRHGVRPYVNSRHNVVRIGVRNDGREIIGMEQAWLQSGYQAQDHLLSKG